MGGMSRSSDATSEGVEHLQAAAKEMLAAARSFLDLRFDRGWQVDLGELAALITPRTRLISLTCPHNPTGAVFDEATLRGAVAPLGAVVAVALPWAFVPAVRPRRVRDAWAVPVLLAVLHPAAGALAKMNRTTVKPRTPGAYRWLC